MRLSIPGVMLKNLPASPKRLACLFLFISLFSRGRFLTAQEEAGESFPPDEAAFAAMDEISWYLSNTSGMTLQPSPSRFVALRSEYCLAAGKVSPGYLPVLLLPYYDESLGIELRILYEKGAELRRQWIMRDDKGLARVAASGTGGLFGGNVSDEGERSGFIEIRNGEGALERELRFEADLSEWEFRFVYRDNVLLSTGTWFREAPSDAAEENGREPGSGPVNTAVSTDYFRYTRSGSLRAIERVLHGEAGEKLSRVSFPRIGKGVSPDNDLVIQGVAHASEFLQDIRVPGGVRIIYTVDGRGRILTEVWKDEDGETLAEYLNTWSGDRLLSVHWKSIDDERLIEYEYGGDGARVAERNYRRGELERSVTVKNGRETEEIFMNGRVILRAYWENGMKISEERVSR